MIKKYRKKKRSLKEADHVHAKFVAFIGEHEIIQGTIALREVSTGKNTSAASLQELIEQIG